jgi:hypothetical protein
MATTNIQSFPGDVDVTSNLTVDTNTLHVDSVTGNVGIGTTNPGGFDVYNKEINQTFRVDGTNIHRNNKYYVDSRDDAAPCTITTRYAVSAADDNGASAERSELVLGATADENYPLPGSSFISFSDSKKLYLGSHPDADFMSDWSTVSNQAYPRMGSNTFAPHVTLLPSGNVGIGTDSPSYKLDVNGTSNVGALTATTGTFSGIVTVPKLSVSADSNVYFSDTAANYGTSTGYDTFRVGRMNYSPSSVTNANGAVYVSAGDLSMKAQGLYWAIAEDAQPKGAEIYLEGGRSIKAGQTHGSIYFRTAGSTHEVGSDRMVIDGDTGNVGIGTDSPSYKLDVNGTSNVGALTATTGTFSDDLTVSGNLTVSGTTTTVDTTNLTIKDAIVELGKDNTAGETDLGIIMRRPGSNVGIIYDGSASKLEIGHTLSGGSEGTITMDTSNALAVNVNGALTATSVSGNGSGLTSLNADKIAAGTINNLRLNSASTTGAGIVKLSDNTSGTSTELAATESAVKAAYDRNSWGSGTFSDVLKLEGGSTTGDANVDDANKTNTYIRFGEAGTVTDWAYLRQIGGGNAIKLALDFHDDNEARFEIRKNYSTQNPDVVTTVFSVDDGALTATSGTFSGALTATTGALSSTTSSTSTSTGALTVVGGLGVASNIHTSNLFASDYVGIGTASPASALEIYGEGKDLAFKYDTGITRSSAANRDSYYSAKENRIKRVGDRNLLDNSPFTPDTTHEILLGFSDTYTQYQTNDEYYPSYNEMRFKLWTPTNSTTGSLNDIMTLRSNGNVGIGTTSPGYKLDVNGLASSKTSRVFEFSGSDNYARHFWICSFLDAPGYHTNQLIKINYSVTYKRLTGTHSRNSIASGTVTLSDLWRYSTDGNSGEFQYVTLQDQKNEQYSGQGRVPKWYYVRFNNIGYLVLSMSISDGNTSSYYVKGNVDFLTRPSAESADRIFNGTVYKDSSLAQTEGFTSISDLYPTTGTGVDGWDTTMTSSSTAQNFIEATEGTVFKYGNVGIGTANPLSLLTIKTNYSGGESSGLCLDSYDGSVYNFRLYSFVQSAGNVGWKFRVNNGASSVDALTLGSTGNVGIGTTDPLDKLMVMNGTIRSHDSGNTINIPGLKIRRRLAAADQTGSNYIECGQFSDVGNDASGTDGNKFVITNSGDVGIGTTNPSAPLHVNGANNLNTSSASRTYFYYLNSTNLTSDTSTWGDASIYATHSIVSSLYFASIAGTIGASDTRIKKNIVDADDAECLEVLRLLKPKKYQYKDEINRGTEPVWGFIAQEVRETLPHATQLRQDVLPNIYELANVSSSNVITFINFNTSNLESNATTLIRTKGIDGEDHDIHLAEVIDEHSIRVEEDLSAWIGSVDAEGNVITQIETTTLTPEEYEALEVKTGYVANITGYQNANVVVSIEEYNALEDTTGYEEVIQDYTKTTTIYPGTQLFVYGQEVDDFIFVKKEAIWTVATSALQEVDRQQQSDKLRITELETQLASVLARLDALEAA